jgi:hypothetical protein
VLVGYRQSTDWDKQSPSGDPAYRDDWRFLVKKKKVKPRVEQLAPGLAVLRPGKITGKKVVKVGLRDAEGNTIGTFKARKKVSKFRAAAPGVTALKLTVSSGYRWGDEITATVELDAPPPADAVALVLYLGEGDSAVAISWANVKGSTATSFTIFQSHNHCGGNAPGMRAPKAADLVTFAWIDPFGRKSPRSATVKTQ